MLDSEFTAAAVRGLLGFTATEVNDILVGATVSGTGASRVITIPQNDGTSISLAVPDTTGGGGEGADGVVASGAFNDDQTELVLTLDTGGTVTINVPAALRAGGILAMLNSDGTAPDASANQGKVLFSGNQILHSINHGGHDKEVTFKEYGPDRVVVGSEPARSANENNYGGSFEFPPHDDIADYDVDTVLWDRGSEVWLLKPASDSTRWSSYSGPLGWEHGHIYATEAVAERHVGSVLAVGKIYIYGYGSTQKPYIVTAFTAATDDVWVWDPIGLTPADVSAIVKGESGNGRYFVVPESGVAVSNNVATLTTGQSISSLQDGDLFYFRSNFTNTAAEVMVNIDGTGQHDIRINNRQNNGDEALPAGLYARRCLLLPGLGRQQQPLPNLARAHWYGHLPQHRRPGA